MRGGTSGVGVGAWGLGLGAWIEGLCLRRILGILGNFEEIRRRTEIENCIFL